MRLTIAFATMTAMCSTLACEAISSAAGNEEANALANDAALSVDSALKESALLLAMTDGSCRRSRLGPPGGAHTAARRSGRFRHLRLARR